MSVRRCGATSSRMKTSGGRSSASGGGERKNSLWGSPRYRQSAGEGVVMPSSPRKKKGNKENPGGLCQLGQGVEQAEITANQTFREEQRHNGKKTPKKD